MCPTFQLPLTSDGICLGRKFLVINEFNGSAAGRPKRAATVIVDVQTAFEIASVADVERPIGAAQDVDVEARGIC